jgi:hypothetical protein
LWTEKNLKKIKECKTYDALVHTMIDKLCQNPTLGHSMDWSNEKGLLLFRGEVYVPLDPDS